MKKYERLAFIVAVFGATTVILRCIYLAVRTMADMSAVKQSYDNEDMFEEE